MLVLSSKLMVEILDRPLFLFPSLWPLSNEVFVAQIVFDLEYKMFVLFYN